MRGFMAGQRSTLASEAMMVAARRLSASPAAREARKEAVAGATRMASANRPSSTWGMRPERGRKKSLWQKALSPLKASKVSGVMKASAPEVRTTLTFAPFFWRSLRSAGAL